MAYTYPYPRPSVTVDIVLLRPGEAGLEVLLIQRGRPPFEGAWALPGGFVEENEPLEAAAARELQEETHLEGLSLQQLGAFGDPGRDPRGWTVTVAFWAQLTEAGMEAQADDDAADARWWPLQALPILAFDHAKILERANAVIFKAS